MVWLLPMALGLAGLLLTFAVNRLAGAEAALVPWAISYALLFSPAFSWTGWLLALPPVALALWRGWFGWGSAGLIGAGAGALAGAMVDTELALPFAIVSLLALRALMGRLLPL
jgi:hypothetical protein